MNYLLPIVGVLFLMSLSRWVLPPAGQKFAAYFKSAEERYNLPPNILARIAQQESSFLPDIISGKKQSPAGAVGLMQIIPKYHPTVDPTDPLQSIAYAGKYLRDNYNLFNDWRLALAAYNWGPGNVLSYLKGGKKMPQETQNYINQISKDIGL